jgi:hypothetical protein
MKKVFYWILFLIIILVLNALRLWWSFKLLDISYGGVKIYLIICIVLGIPGGFFWRASVIASEKYRNRFDNNYISDTRFINLILTFFTMIGAISILFFMVGFIIISSIIIFKLIVIISHVILAAYVIILFGYLKGLVENKIYEFKKRRLQEDTEKEQQRKIEEERSGYVH